MEGMDATGAEKSLSRVMDSERGAALKARLDRLLREAAEVEVELSRADGSIKGVPHYSVIEGRAHALGKHLSREIQQRQMSELAAAQSLTAKCPECGTRCHLESAAREVNSVDGRAALQELAGYCPCCRRSFFPDA